MFLITKPFVVVGKVCMPATVRARLKLPRALRRQPA